MKGEHNKTNATHRSNSSEKFILTRNNYASIECE